MDPPRWREPLTLLGRAYLELRDYPRARAAYTTALTAHQAARDPEGATLCLGGLGLCALGLGAPADAAQLLQQAITLCERRGDTAAELAWHPHLDHALAQLDRGALRIPRLQRQIALLDLVGDAAAAARVAALLVEVAIDQHELRIARETLNDTTRRLSRLGDDPETTALRTRMAIALPEAPDTPSPSPGRDS